MPTVNKLVTVPLNGVIDNVLSGSQYEYLPFPAYIEVGLTGAAIGVLTTIFSGPDVLAEEGAVSLGTANVYPKYPDEFYYTDEAAPGDRLRIQLRNTTGANIIVAASVRIRPLG